MKIREFLENYQPTVISCRRSDTLQSAAMLLHTNRIGAMPVLDANGELVGILSERDIVSALSQRPQQLMQLKVADIMSSPAVTCNENEEVCDALQVMLNHKFRHLPVVNEGGELRGMLSIRDCLAMQLKNKELEANVLRDSFIAARYS